MTTWTTEREAEIRNCNDREIILWEDHGVIKYRHDPNAIKDLLSWLDEERQQRLAKDQLITILRRERIIECEAKDTCREKLSAAEKERDELKERVAKLEAASEDAVNLHPDLTVLRDILNEAEAKP